MGLLISIPKNHNHLHIDFPEAYWKITDSRVTMEDDTYIDYTFSAYPSKECADYSTSEYFITAMDFGGSTIYPITDSKIYHFYERVPAKEMFPNGIPTDKDMIKTAVYLWFKDYLTNHKIEFTDVFE